MQNLKESFLLSMITVDRGWFILENDLQIAVGVMALTVTFWAVLTWWDGLKEKYKRRKKQ